MPLAQALYSLWCAMHRIIIFIIPEIREESNDFFCSVSLLSSCFSFFCFDVKRQMLPAPALPLIPVYAVILARLLKYSIQLARFITEHLYFFSFPLSESAAVTVIPVGINMLTIDFFTSLMSQ